MFLHHIRIPVFLVASLLCSKERRWWTFKCVYFQLNNISFFSERSMENIFSNHDAGWWQIENKFSRLFQHFSSDVSHESKARVQRRMGRFWIHINFNQSFNWNFNFLGDSAVFLTSTWWKSSPCLLSIDFQISASSLSLTLLRSSEPFTRFKFIAEYCRKW